MDGMLEVAALSLSAGVRKAKELGRRTLSLALTTPRMVEARAAYAEKPTGAVLVLQRGVNASVDYYLRPRAPKAIFADIADDPAKHLDVLGGDGLFVIVCRYVSTAWLDAFEAVRGRIARFAVFLDDDLPEMMKDPDIPAAMRGKVADQFGRHVERLSDLTSEVWVSTPELAARYPGAGCVVLAPVPEAAYPCPAAIAPRLAVYHGSDAHPVERRFVLDVARRLARLDATISVEIAGGPSVAHAAADLGNVQVIRQRPWPKYLEAQSGRRAAVSLAPLTSGRLNAARAPVKVFDAARLGAAGLFADTAPYRDWVRPGVDGLLLPMDPAVWAQAIADLVNDDARRLAMATAAWARVEALRADPGGFPAPARRPT